MYRFSHLVFPFVFLVILGAFTQLLSAKRLIDPWVGGETNLNYALAKGSTEQYERPNTYGILLTYFSLIFSLYYFSRKDYQGNKIYLLAIAIASFSAHIISQTRGWIAVSFFIVFLFIFFIQKFRFKNLLYITIGLFFFYILYSNIPALTIAVDNGLGRFATVESFAKGDVTAGGTNIRFTERLPKVMEGIRENPITGLGFSDEYWKYADYHVGFATMLLQIGILGYLLFIAFWIKFFTMVHKNNHRLLYGHPMKGPLLIFSIALAGSLLLHFTSYQFMGFEFMQPADYFYICLLFSFADTAMKESMFINKHLEIQRKIEIEKFKLRAQNAPAKNQKPNT